MLTPDPRHDLYGALTVIAARASLEQRRLQAGNVDCARTTAVLAEIVAGVQDLTQQIDHLARRAEDGGRNQMRIIVAD